LRYPRLVRRWSYRRRSEVSPDRFITHLEDEFGRPIDDASRAFFQNHPISTGILHEILVGRLVADGSEQDERVITALLNDMAFSTPDLDPVVYSSSTPLSDVIEAFSRRSPDAGSVMGQATVRFLDLRRSSQKKR
jgi:hypothetical protein